MRALALAFGRGAAIALLLAPVAACEAWSATAPSQDEAPLALTGRVVDAADILDASQEAQLTNELATLERDTKVQLVVVSTPTLGGYDITDYSIRLGNSWGIGDADRDDGLLLVVAPTEKKVRISVGLGLEQTLPDPLCAKIVEEMVAQFSDGELASGTLLGADRLSAELRQRLGTPG